MLLSSYDSSSIARMPSGYITIGRGPIHAINDYIIITGILGYYLTQFAKITTSNLSILTTKQPKQSSIHMNELLKIVNKKIGKNIRGDFLWNK